MRSRHDTRGAMATALVSTRTPHGKSPRRRPRAAGAAADAPSLARPYDPMTSLRLPRCFGVTGLTLATRQLPGKEPFERQKVRAGNLRNLEKRPRSKRHCPTPGEFLSFGPAGACALSGARRSPGGFTRTLVGFRPTFHGSICASLRLRATASRRLPARRLARRFGIGRLGLRAATLDPCTRSARQSAGRAVAPAVAQRAETHQPYGAAGPALRPGGRAGPLRRRVAGEVGRHQPGRSFGRQDCTRSPSWRTWPANGPNR